jgi:hypothetical protein
MTDLPQLQEQLVAAAAARRSRRRGGAMVLARGAGAALVAAAVVAVLVVPFGGDDPGERSADHPGGGGELRELVAAFGRPARAGDRPRWPGAQRGAWRRVGRAGERRVWLGRSGSELCLVVDWLPWAQESVRCRPASQALSGRRTLGHVDHEERGRIVFAIAVVPSGARTVGFLLRGGGELSPQRGGAVAAARAPRDRSLSAVRFETLDGRRVVEPLRFRQPGVPAGIVDSFGVWRREQQASDRPPAGFVPPGRPETWRRVGTGRAGVRQWIRWSREGLCPLVQVGDRLVNGRCAPEDQAFGGIVTETGAGVRAIVAQNRMRWADVVRADGSGDRYRVTDNGVVVPARDGDRAVRLLDATGRVLRVWRLSRSGIIDP